MSFSNRTTNNLLKRLNWPLIAITSILLIIGLINIYSASYQTQDTFSNLFYMQLLWALLGVVVFFFVSFTNYRLLTRTAYILYGINIASLMAVSLFGSVFGGAKRWLDLGLFNYQPSETTKLVLIILLARILSTKRSWRFMTFAELLKPALLIALPIVFIVSQPDLGTALITLFITGSILIFAKVDKNILLFSLAVIIVVTPLTWNFGLKEYQKNRILAFISPDRDPSGTGYNIIQSKIAIGSGRIFGKGFQKGTQSQLEFLPERSTDFIFSVLSEEYGFVGSIITVLLFLILTLIGFHSAFQSRDKDGVFLCVGMSFYLFWHTFINIGMTMGIVPVAGIPLPLISYGGSSLLTTMLVLGVISSVSCRKYLF